MKAQTRWGWAHAVYFWLGGLGAGAYVIGVIASFAGADWTSLARIGVFLGFPCVAIGALILLVDLGKPLNAIHAWKYPGTSWVSRGIIILSVFMVLGAIHIFFWIWPFSVLEGAARHIVGILGLIFAFGVMIYTGFLLAANRPIGSWSNPMLPLLFLANALFTGSLAVLLFGSILAADATAQLKVMETTVILLAIVQLFALAFFVYGNHRDEESRASSEILLSGTLSSLFWFGVIILGLAVPLVLELVNVLGAGGGGGALAMIAAIAGLIGSLLLRQSILASGVLAPLRAGRFEFALPHI